MSTIKINELITSNITDEDLIIKSDSNGNATKNTVANLAANVAAKIDANVQGKTFQLLTQAMAVSPLPDDYTPFKIANETPSEYDGNYIYLDSSGGYLFLGNSLGEVSENNSTSAVTGEGVINYINSIKLTENFTDKIQETPLKWTLTSGGKIENNIITINANGVQAKINIDNQLTLGNKYILLINIEKVTALNSNVTSLVFYNSGQLLHTYSLDSSLKIIPIIFTASTIGNLQVLVNGTNVNNSNIVPIGTELVEFESNFIGCIEWTEEKEIYWSEVSENYLGGGFEQKVVDESVMARKTLGLIENSFNNFTDLTSKVKSKYTVDISDFTPTNNSLNITNEVVNGVYRFGGTYDYTASFTRLWPGFDIKPVNYEDEEKTYVAVLKGSVTATNGDDFVFRQSSGKVIEISQDLEDGVTSNFKVLGTFTYSAGQSNNLRYTYCDVTRKDSSIDFVTYLAEFEVFSIFEEIEGFTIDDYINASKQELIIPIYSPLGTATEEFVDNSINESLNNVSKLSPNDLNPIYDIEMFLSGGQSLNVGGGASSGLTDWKNTPSFAYGSSLFQNPFATQADKDAFYGTEFIKIEDGNATNEQFPPVTASLNTVLSLLEKENRVDVSKFGYQMMPFTWGVSGSSIASMVKGSTAYGNMIECVAKAKEFSNKEGKTFGVRSMNWYHGEADRNQTKQWYYDRMSQLFIDVNTDIKAITGQSIDIQFFTYQTSPWLGRDVGTVMTHINIQEAQMQVVKDFANVNFCGAMYQFEYSDYYHPTDRAVVGIQTGVAMKRILHDNENWKNFLPISHQVINDGTNYFINLKFEVPTKPMRFDESGDAWHNPRGKQTNFGFEVLNGSTELQTTEPFIVRGDTVVLSVGTTNPVGATIRYAVNGHDGGGNLCDSQNIIVRNKNVDYVVDNFAAAFSEYIIS